MSQSEYRVELLEHDGVPYTCGVFTGKQAAWKRVSLAISALVSIQWPVWARVYEVRPAIVCSHCGTQQDEWQHEYNKDCRCGGPFTSGTIEALVWSEDITTRKRATSAKLKRSLVRRYAIDPR